jgi:hydroxymethylpyrimidine pyrophosphatase-like HAD family hydrolase
LLAAHGLTLAQVAAFGDDVSDVPLLAAAGHAVAVAGGHPAALAAADEIAAAPPEDGIARVLARLFPELRLDGRS